MPDLLLLHGGLVVTLDRANPTASAMAIKSGVFTAVGGGEDIMPLAGPSTRIIDLRGRRVLPGLIEITSTLSAADRTSAWSCAGTACAASPMAWRCSSAR
jgi:dihydroorotase-like cyclic amidohydrolase